MLVQQRLTDREKLQYEAVVGKDMNVVAYQPADEVRIAGR